jgi:hypothetical protein
MFRALLLGPVLRAINQLERKIMPALDTLTTEVSEATTVMQSAATLLTGLKTQLDEAIAKLEQGDNGEALNALSAQLDTESNSLAEAVAANTPGDTGGGEEPTPETPTSRASGSAFTPGGSRMR